MKPRCSNRRNHGLTLSEVLVSITILMILAAILLPANGPHRARTAWRIRCVNNLKQASLAARIWEGDHGGQYPMAVSTTNGGAMELATAGMPSLLFK